MLHPFYSRWPERQELDNLDYPHSYHVAHSGTLAVSMVCSCKHGIGEHEDFMKHLVDLLNEPEVRRIALENHGLTIYNESEYKSE